MGLKQNMGFESVEACHKPVPCIFEIKLAGLIIVNFEIMYFSMYLIASADRLKPYEREKKM